MPKSLTEDTGVSSWLRKGALMSDIFMGRNRQAPTRTAYTKEGETFHVIQKDKQFPNQLVPTLPPGSIIIRGASPNSGTAKKFT